MLIICQKIRFMANKLFLLIILALAFTYVAAQKLSTGTLIGTIVDKESSLPIEFATVLLQSETDSSHVQGTTTDSKGSLILIRLPMGNTKLALVLLDSRNRKRI